MTTALSPDTGNAPHTGTGTVFHAASSGPAVAHERRSVLRLHLRELRGDVPLKAAAAAVGIRPDELSKIEQGKTRQIRWETLLRLVIAYHCNVSDLVTLEVIDAPDTTAAATPRDTMLTALRADAGRPVPKRKVNPGDVDPLGALTQPALTASDEAAAYEHTPDRPVRRRFTPADSH